MKNSIQGNQYGKTVNVFINGKLRKKICDTIETATDFFTLILEAGADPSDEAIRNIFAYLNEKTRTAMMCGLETDPDTGEVYLAGFNTPVPMALVEVIKDYHEKNYPMEAILNFWKLLMLNPDKEVRTSLFDFIKTHDFVLTDTGYMVVYKAVSWVGEKQNTLAEFVTNQYLHVKKDWACSPKKYMVYKNLSDNSLQITKVKTASKWDAKKKNVELLGNLKEMNSNLESLSDNSAGHYTDMHTHKMVINLGVPVVQERDLCDADPRNSCSNGLHVGATNYVERFARSTSPILVCYVNPAHVVAVPNHDHSKMRVSEYFPFAIANYEDRKIDIIEQTYFESDYTHYEADQLEEMVASVQADEVPIKTAISADEDVRPLSELEKIIEDRLVELTS